MSQVLNGWETTFKNTNPCDVTTTDVLASNKCALDVAIQSGSVSSVPSGLSTAGLITEVTLSAASWTALPATALTNRNGLGIQNATGTEIKLNFDNTEPGYIGWRIAANGETFIDIRDTVTIYAKAAAGTPTITIMEIS